MKNKQWKTDLSAAIRDAKALEEHFPLKEEERAFFTDPRTREGVPFAVSEYYLSLITPDPADPIRRQCIPTAAEFDRRSCETSDPLHEADHTPVPRLVRRYRDRALLLVNDGCAVYCRHCFRRHFTGHASGAVTDEELRAVCAYLRDHPEVKELLLSGGDPLLLDDGRLEGILKALRQARPDLLFRLATRVPVTLPSRINEDLTALLARFFPLWLITQFNHPAEITAQSSGAIKLFLSAGIPCLNQTVLLGGVNDRADLLGELFRGLVSIGVKPYYLFQGDLAAGTSHFRVPLETGWRIFEELRAGLSGLALPVYAVDLPGGGGKIPLERGRFVEETEGAYTFRNIEGRLYSYPKEEQNEG